MWAVQVSLSQMCSISSQVGGANLLHELLGFLRRCLAQQAEVRSVLYQVRPGVPRAPEAALVPLDIWWASCLLGTHIETPQVDSEAQPFSAAVSIVRIGS